MLSGSIYLDIHCDFLWTIEHIHFIAIFQSSLIIIVNINRN